MRVFKNYRFDLKDQVLFKNTFKYVEEFLAKENLQYNGLGFMFDSPEIDKLIEKYPEMSGLKKADKLIERYPELKKYRKKSETITSVSRFWPEDKSIHVLKTDESVVKEVTTKIPRPYNFSFMRIVLDNVNWYDNIDCNPATNELNEPSAVFNRYYQTNSIELIKNSELGKKHNPIIVKIEATRSEADLIDDKPILKKLTDWFGKPVREEMIVVFDKEELIEIKKSSEALQAIVDRIQKSIAMPDNLKPTVNKSDPLKYSYPGLTALRNISPKQAMRKTVKPYGYKYLKYENYRYVCRKINLNNHCFDIASYVEKYKGIGSNLEIKGINFNIVVKLGEFSTETQEIMEEGFAQVLKFAEQIEKEIAGPLFNLFGATPHWYEYTV